MKLTKLFTAFAVMAFLITGCSSDDNNEILRPDNKDQVEVPSGLPITGKYIFPHTEAMPLPFTFTKDKIVITYKDDKSSQDEVYDVHKVYKNSTNIIKAVTSKKDVEGFKVFFFRNETEEGVEINMDYDFDKEEDAIKSAYPLDQTKARINVRIDNPHGNMKFGWLKLRKSKEGFNLDKLKGDYGSVKVGQGGIAQYVFRLGNEDEAFIFMVEDEASASFKLKKVAEDDTIGQLIYEVTGSTGYYAGRTGQFLTIYAKDISETGDKATLAIATKDGSGSVAGSKGDIVGKTIEEAKTIKAPEADKVWKEDMMTYAHVWIPTIRK